MADTLLMSEEELNANFRLVVCLALKLKEAGDWEVADNALRAFAEARKLPTPETMGQGLDARQMEFDISPSTPAIDVVSILDSFHKAAEAAGLQAAWARAEYKPRSSNGAREDEATRQRMAERLTERLDEELLEVRNELEASGLFRELDEEDFPSLRLRRG